MPRVILRTGERRHGPESLSTHRLRARRILRTLSWSRRATHRAQHYAARDPRARSGCKRAAATEFETRAASDHQSSEAPARAADRSMRFMSCRRRRVENGAVLFQCRRRTRQLHALRKAETRRTTRRPRQSTGTTRTQLAFPVFELDALDVSRRA